MDDAVTLTFGARMHQCSPPAGVPIQSARGIAQLSDENTTTTWLKPGFSVVLFRSDFVLVSEKSHMKVHKNQRVRTMLYSPECLSDATSRGQTMAPETQKPSQ